MPKVEVNGFDLYYETYGEGFPLVLIMGLGANLDWWTPEFLDPLSKKFQVIEFDNRGTGRSGDPGEVYTLQTLAGDVIGLMDVLEIQKAHILGISMGGMIAQEVVLNYPERVEKLVLCSTNVGGRESVQPSREILALLMTDRSSQTEEDIARATISLLFTPEFIEEHPETIETFVQQILKAPIAPDSFSRQFKAIMQFTTAKRLKSVNTPTLVVHGKQDILIPPENGEILAKLIPGAKLTLIDDYAHAAFANQTEQVYATIIDF